MPPVVATKPSPLAQSALEQLKPLPSAPMASAALVELGKMLFFEPRLSKSQFISCNSCHNLGIGGADLQKTSVGHNWQTGPRNAPTVLNAGLHVAQFWDGRAPDLEAQAKGPVQAGVEMANTPAIVESTLRSMPGYLKAFGSAFVGQEQPVTFDNMAKAIAAFEATLLTPSRFDKFLGGDAQALNGQEQKGLKMFLDDGCAACHSGSGIGGQSYFKFGVVKAPNNEVRPVDDKGRMKVTGKAEDEYVFRTATLRNIELTGPYFHSGAVSSLKQAIAIMGETQLGKTYNTEEIDALEAFLMSLTGTQPQVTYPVLPGSTDVTPSPDLR